MTTVIAICWKCGMTFHNQDEIELLSVMVDGKLVCMDCDIKSKWEELHNNA
jgi:hypothetical protein